MVALATVNVSLDTIKKMTRKNSIVNTDKIAPIHGDENYAA